MVVVLPPHAGSRHKLSIPKAIFLLKTHTGKNLKIFRDFFLPVFNHLAKPKYFGNPIYCGNPVKIALTKSWEKER
jgi:hypothetical protein